MSQYASYSGYIGGGGGGGGGVTSLNGETGAVNIVAGSGITVTPVGQNITIASTSSGAATSIGALDSQPANANGLALVANVLSTQSADSTHPGMVNNTTQTFTGIKTFSNNMVISPASATALVINSAAGFTFDTSSATNARLGMGQASGTGTNLNIAADTSAATMGCTFTGYGANDFAIRMRRAKGTLAAPTNLIANDILGDIGFFGYGTTAFGASSTGIIHCRAAETFTDTAKGTFLTVSTTPLGSITRAEMVRFNYTGNLLVGTSTDNNTDKLQVNGSIVGSNLSGTNTGDVTLGTANGLSLAGQALSLGLSSTSTTGSLSSTDWNTFNNKQAALTPGSISTTTTGVTVGSGSNSTVGPNVTVNIQNATTAQNGLLTSTDWNTFNNKQASGNYITALTGDIVASGPGSATATYNGIVPTAKGGTNLSSYITGDTLYSSAANVLSKLAIGSTGDVLTVAGGVPTWAPISAAIITSWTAYTPTFTNSGTASNIEFFWRQVGPDSIDITGRVTFAAGGSASELQISIPSGLTVDVAIVSTQRTFGEAIIEAGNSASWSSGAAGGNTYFVALDQQTFSNVTGANASALTWNFHLSGLPVTGL